VRAAQAVSGSGAVASLSHTITLDRRSGVSLPQGGADDSGDRLEGEAANGRLAELLLHRLREADFGGVVDFGRRSAGAPAPKVAHSPHVDLAVIELDPAGQARAAANVQQSRDCPEGRVTELGEDLRTLNTDFRAWDLERWDELTAHEFAIAPYAEDSALVPGTDGVPFMSPYPASMFKLLVAVQVLRQVDARRLALSQRTVNLAPGAPGIEGRSLPPRGAEPTVAEALDAMITYSDNVSTCLLLQELHRLGQLDPGSNALNRTFADLGMPTLQVNDTDPATGTQWGVGAIHMTAMDTARLLLLLQGGRLSFRGARGLGPSELLTSRSRRLLLSLLEQQGLHEVLSTTNWCGRPYPGSGIPARVPERWVGAGGTVTVDAIRYGCDVRPCNVAAQVTFAHKTGLTENYGSDAGIVTALRGQDGRRYVVAIFTNLGYRFSDASRASDVIAPGTDESGVCYSQKFAELGRGIDDLFRLR
jgi:hypothetical protein